MTGWSAGPPDAITELESANALRQYDHLCVLIGRALTTDRGMPVTPEMICDLNRLAVQDLEPLAGRFRDGPATIQGSSHVPPPHDDVPGLVDEMCEVVNARGQDAAELAAYALWRLNWIHPFAEGNGRTARAVAYFVLCRELDVLMPGRQTLPERIVAEKLKYYRCLEAADEAWKRTKQVGVSNLAGFLRRLTRAQFAEAVAGHRA